MKIKNIDSASNPNKQHIWTFGDKFEKELKNPLKFQFLINNKLKTVEEIVEDIYLGIEANKLNIEDINLKIKELKKSLKEYIDNQKEIDKLISNSIDLLNIKYNNILERVEKLEEN